MTRRAETFTRGSGLGLDAILTRVFLWMIFGGVLASGASGAPGEILVVTSEQDPDQLAICIEFSGEPVQGLCYVPKETEQMGGRNQSPNGEAERVTQPSVSASDAGGEGTVGERRARDDDDGHDLLIFHSFDHWVEAVSERKATLAARDEEQLTEPEFAHFEIPLNQHRRNETQDWKRFERQLRRLVWATNVDSGGDDGDRDIGIFSRRELKTLESLRLRDRRAGEASLHFAASQLDQWSRERGMGAGWLGRIKPWMVYAGVLLSCGLFVALIRWLLSLRSNWIEDREKRSQELKEKIDEIDRIVSLWVRSRAGNVDVRDDARELWRKLDQIDGLLEKSRDLQQGLSDLLGDPEKGLPTLHSKLHGHLSELRKDGADMKLPQAFEEHLKLRRIFEELSHLVPNVMAKGTDAEEMRTRIQERLRQLQEVENHVREILGVESDPQTVETCLKASSRLAHWVAGNHGVEWERIPELLEAARNAVEELTLDLHEAKEGSLADRLVRLVEHRKALRNELEKERSSRKKLQASQERAKQALASHCQDETTLEEGIRALSRSHVEIGTELDRWVGHSDGSPLQRAREVSTNLQELCSAFLTEKSSLDWKSHLEEKLREGARAAKMRKVFVSEVGLEGRDDLVSILVCERELPHRYLRKLLLGSLDRIAGLETGRSMAERNLFNVLRLSFVAGEARSFLTNLSEWKTADQLWEEGLVPALARQWLHSLLRAELVLDTYFAGRREHELFGPVRSLSEAFRWTLACVGHPVMSVRLLEPRPTLSTQIHDVSKLSGFESVASEVRRRQGKGGRFVVDVKSFAIENYPSAKECQVILYNPADWHSSQRRSL